MDSSHSANLVFAADEQARLRQLVDYDEKLRRGEVVAGATTQIGASTDADARACLEVLEFVFPRAAAAALPEHVGRFEIEKVLGQGGFGVVYLARDPRLGRRVALKIPRPHVLGRAELRERFLREAQAAARLDHPHIVPLHEVGIDGGVCYLSSAYCDGGTLHDWLRRRTGPVPVELAAQLVLQLADGIEHAHTRGVLHRDLKPTNVLLVNAAPLPPSAKRSIGGTRDLLLNGSPTGGESERRTSNVQGPTSNDSMLDVRRSMLDICSSASPPDEPLASGGPEQSPTLKITDFGLAKFFDGEGGDTQSGVMFGTPAYMSPEQAASGMKHADLRSDVYGLGIILYELLTGSSAFVGDQAEIMQKLLNEAAPSPRNARPDIPRDLETVYLKATARNRDERYATAGEFAADLRRWLAHERVIARRPRAPLGKKLLTRRNFVGLSLATLPAIGFGVWAGNRRVNRDEPIVNITTNPVGAEIYFIPLQKLTLEPQPKRIIHAGRSPVELPLPPGEYLVEAVLDNTRFHEVHRTVPEPGSRPPYYIRSFRVRKDGVMQMGSIVIPPATIAEGMAYVPGADKFQMGRRDAQGDTRLFRHVPAYYMDPVELTVGEYRDFGGVSVEDLPRCIGCTDLHALPLTFDSAIRFAEKRGKRLPDEAEYEFAATAGGTRTAAGPNDTNPLPGPVREPAADRVDLDPHVPIYGLDSNIAEWTINCPGAYPNTAVMMTGLPSPLSYYKIARGAVAEGVASPLLAGERPTDSFARHVLTPAGFHNYVGVRLIRSVKPRLTVADFTRPIAVSEVHSAVDG